MPIFTESSNFQIQTLADIFGPSSSSSPLRRSASGGRRPFRLSPSAAMAKGPGLFSNIGKNAKGIRLLLVFESFKVFVFSVYFCVLHLFYDVDCAVVLVDLLKKDYTADPKLTLSTFSDIGVVYWLLSCLHSLLIVSVYLLVWPFVSWIISAFFCFLFWNSCIYVWEVWLLRALVCDLLKSLNHWNERCVVF